MKDTLTEEVILNSLSEHKIVGNIYRSNGSNCKSNIMISLTASIQKSKLSENKLLLPLFPNGDDLNWQEMIAPFHFLSGNDVGVERTSTWLVSWYCLGRALAESIDVIHNEKFLSYLIFLGGLNPTLNLKKREFFFVRILSLRNVTLVNERYLKQLSFLQYLDLKHTNVRDCDWLEGLEELQMLDLRYTCVEEIPDKCLQKLRKLQHLRLGYIPKRDDNRLAGVKLNMKKLITKNLKTLRGIRRPEKSENIGSVSNVVDLSVTGLKTEQLKSLWNDMENFENLTNLGVAVTKDSVITLQDCPPKLKKKLKRLLMESQIFSGLANLCEFKSLIDLSLTSHKPIKIISIPPLPYLLCLRLYGLHKETICKIGVQGFDRLKKLVIGDMDKVQSVQIASAVIETVAIIKLCNLPQFRELVCLDTQLPLLKCSFECKTNVHFKEVRSQKAIFLRSFDNNVLLHTSPGLKMYHYDMNKQCYKEVY